MSVAFNFLNLYACGYTVFSSHCYQEKGVQVQLLLFVTIL